MQVAPPVGDAERVIAGFRVAVRLVHRDHQRFVEEHLFRLGLTDAVLVDALARVARVPVETKDPAEVQHRPYITTIYV